MTEAIAKIQITPSMMAQAFWAMESTEQIKFFHELAQVIKEDHKTNSSAYNLGELQWCYMADDLYKKENDEARHMLMTMASFLYLNVLRAVQGY